MNGRKKPKRSWIWNKMAKNIGKLTTKIHWNIDYDYYLSYNELLKKTKCESIHVQNLQLMLVEVYKNFNNLGNKLGWDQFEIIQRKNDEDDEGNDWCHWIRHRILSKKKFIRKICEKYVSMYSIIFMYSNIFVRNFLFQ